MKKRLLPLMLATLAVQHFDVEASGQYQQSLARVSTETGEQISYQQLIEEHKLTGLSLAVVDNYEVVFSHAAGLKEAGTTNKIDRNTAFSTASISKPVTATIAFMLAEQGKLDLDAPVSQYLTSWSMPSSPLTKITPITLRHLLSHTAGTTQGGFVDFYLGDDIPTPIDSLNGVKVLRYNSPISVMFEPGTDWQYSGGGYVMAQVAIEDITGKPLAQLAQEMLFSPLDMQHTTMYQHGEKGFLTNVAKVHDAQQQVIGTGIPICPQIAPSGMWSTALDMAKFMIEYQKALAGKPTNVISPWVATASTEILSIDNIGSWGFGGWSAGWMRFEGDGNQEWFSHGGSNTGTGGHVMGTMTGGKAIIIFGNGHSPIRIPVINTIKTNIIQSLGWQQTLMPTSEKAPVELVNSLSGRYLSSFEHVISIARENDLLVVKNLHGQDSVKPLVYLGNKRFGMNNSNLQIGLKNSGLAIFRKNTGISDQSVRKLGKQEQLPGEVAKSQNFEQTLAAYQTWKTSNPDSRLHSPQTINRAGYLALNQNNFELALKMFKVYTHLHPEDSNAFDSLAEAYMLQGNKRKATENYQKSLSMNPDNDNARKMLKKLTL